MALAVPPIAAEVQVSARLDAERVGLEDVLNLELTVDGADPNEVGEPDLGALEGFKLVGGPSTSTEMQFGGGGFRSTVRFSYSLLPNAEGRRTLGPFTVVVAGKAHRTQPIEVEVVAGRVKPAPRRRDPFGLLDPFGAQRRSAPEPETAVGDQVLIQAVVDKASAYVGEQITLTYWLYTLARIQGVQLQEEPTYTGFWAEPIELKERPQLAPKMLNGKQYYALPIRKVALFPTAAGPLTIAPATFALSVAVRSNFMPLFDDVQNIFRKTRGLELQSRALPGPAPPEFSGAVGSFTLAAKVDKQEVKVGDVVALRVEIRGQGNLNGVVPPALPPLKDFKVFDQKTNSEVRTNGDRVGGTKVLEALLQPLVPGEQVVEPIRFAYFDLERGGYRSIATPSLRLRVSGDGASAAALAGAGARQAVTMVRRDIRFLKPLDRSQLGPARRLYARPIYWALLALPLLGLGASWLIERRRARRRSDVGWARQQSARRSARRRLRLARRLARDGGAAFYAEISRAVLDYAGDRFNRAGVGLTREDLRSLVGAVDAEVAAGCEAVLDACDEARFAGVTRDPAARAELIAQAERAILRLHQALEGRT